MTTLPTDRAGRIAEAVRLLGEARDSGRRLATPPFEIADDEEATAIHFAAVAAVGPIRGWKVGAASPEATPAAGALTADTLFDGPATLPAYALGAVEGEIAVRIGRDLPARDEPYTTNEVLAAVASWHPAIEVLESAFDGWRGQPKPWKVADRQSHGALVLGAASAEAPRTPLGALPVRLSVDGAIAFDHEGGNTAGDPTRLLVWLANHLRGTERFLKAGDVVTTGSATPFLQAKPGQRVRVEFAELGSVEATFGA
ncbi:2-keto-4-pentenoate hydratase [Methylopila musalis]|uniref:2-keto-4-pentenoate hydratase n=1 Tax=Methylopila musalis TaxID=1134781 RepID=A0ABW3Z6X8_9HYPH